MEDGAAIITAFGLLQKTEEGFVLCRIHNKRYCLKYWPKFNIFRILCLNPMKLRFLYVTVMVKILPLPQAGRVLGRKAAKLAVACQKAAQRTFGFQIHFRVFPPKGFVHVCNGPAVIHKRDSILRKPVDGLCRNRHRAEKVVTEKAEQIQYSGRNHHQRIVVDHQKRCIPDIELNRDPRQNGGKDHDQITCTVHLRRFQIPTDIKRHARHADYSDCRKNDGECRSLFRDEHRKIAVADKIIFFNIKVESTVCVESKIIERRENQENVPNYSNSI